MKLASTTSKGIYTTDSRKGKVYYGSYRCKITNKVKRRKIGLKREVGTPKEASQLLLNSLDKEYEDYLKLQEKQEIIEDTYNNNLCLNDFKDKYFKYREEKNLSKLRSDFNYLSEREFLESTIRAEKIKTVNKDRSLYEKHIEPYEVASLPLERVNQKVVSDYQKELNKTKLSETSKYNVVALLRACFKHGINEEWISLDNPFTTKHIKFDKGNRKRERALTNKEVEELLVECKKYNKPQKKRILMKNGHTREITIPVNYNIYLSAYLGQLTAARKMTILHIRKRDINPSTREITLRNFKVKNRIYKQVLPQEAIDWLEQKVFPYYDNEEYLIRPVNSNKRNGKAMSDLPDKLYEIMDNMFNQNLTEEDRLKKITFHNIRHSVATNLLEETNIHIVMKKLDHSSIIQTQNYLDLKDEELTRATEENAKKVFGFASKNKDKEEPQSMETDGELSKEEVLEELLKIEDSAFLRKYYPTRTKEELEELYFKKIISKN